MRSCLIQYFSRLARTESGRVPRDSMPCSIMSVMEWLGRLKWWPTGVSSLAVLTVDLCPYVEACLE